MSLQKSRKMQARKEKAVWMGLFLVSMISVCIFAGITLFLLRYGLKGIGALKKSTELWEYFFNTAGLLILTLPSAAVMGIFGAVYLCEYVKNTKTAERLEFAVEILTGIPSIVFGLFGMVFFGEILHLGYSLLTGSMTLLIMLLPIMIENTKEILQRVPGEYRLGALGLGAGKWQMIRTILLPQSVSGIAAGLTLAAGKVLGESAALLFTAGSKGSLAVAMYRLVGKGKFEEACAVALLLFFIQLFLNLLLQYWRERLSQS